MKSEPVRQLSREQSDAVIAKGRQAYQLEREGKYAAAEVCYLEAWGMLPEPKYDWSDSTSVATAIVEFYLGMKRWDEAIHWIDEALRTRKFDYETHLDILAGRVCLEAGQTQRALSFFRHAYHVGRERAFSGPNRRFLNLLGKEGGDSGRPETD